MATPNYDFGSVLSLKRMAVWSVKKKARRLGRVSKGIQEGD